ncbi:trichohyalin-like [Diprion similis]|uniref:trichohyalin-like n=1 Tax=Diprion similis TaxID=362088 RepID=UPI001EF8752F|nr:trichohyalin-like [Diprion similis]
MPMETRNANKKDSEGTASADCDTQLKYTEADVEFLREEVKNKEKRLRLEQEAIEQRKLELDRKSQQISENLRAQEAEIERRQKELEIREKTILNSNSETQQEIQDKPARDKNQKDKESESTELETREKTDSKSILQEQSGNKENPASDVNDQQVESKIDIPEIKSGTQNLKKESKKQGNLGSSEATDDTKESEPRLDQGKPKISELRQKKIEIDQKLKLLIAKSLDITDKIANESQIRATEADTEVSPDPVMNQCSEAIQVEAEIIYLKNKLKKNKSELEKIAEASKPTSHTEKLADGPSASVTKLADAPRAKQINSESVDYDRASIISDTSVQTNEEKINTKAEVLAKELIFRETEKEMRAKLKELRGVATSGSDLKPQELGAPGAPQYLVSDDDFEIRQRERELRQRERELRQRESELKRQKAEETIKEFKFQKTDKESREKLKELRGGVSGEDLQPQELGTHDAPEYLRLDDDFEIRQKERELRKRELQLEAQVKELERIKLNPRNQRELDLARREEELKARELAVKNELAQFQQKNNENQNYENYRVSKTINQNINIPTLSLTEQSISVKDALAVVPKFDGKNITVLQFNRSCKRALEMVSPSLEGYLTRLIRSKLTDRAYAVIEEENFTTLQQLLDKLSEVFAPTRSANYYRGELGRLYKFADEHILDYISRTRDIKTGLVESERRKNKKLNDNESKELDDEICETFIGGLPTEYRNAILIKGCPTLKTAYERAIDIDKKFEQDKERSKTRESGKPDGEKREPCKHCKQTNHRSENCRSIRKPPSEKPNENGESCAICKRTNHATEDCFHNKNNNRRKDNENRNVNSNLPYCKYCKKLGHTWEECRIRKYHENSRSNQGNGAGPSGAGSSPRAAQANALETETAETPNPSAST